MGEYWKDALEVLIDDYTTEIRTDETVKASKGMRSASFVSAARQLLMDYILKLVAVPEKNSDGLVPCPFCRCQNIGLEQYDKQYTVGYHPILYFYACRNQNCLAEGPADLGKSGAKLKWNASALRPVVERRQKPQHSDGFSKHA